MGLRIRVLVSEGSGEEESLRDSSVEERRTWVQSRRMTALGQHLPPLVFIGVRAMPRVGERGSESWASLGSSTWSPASRLGCGELSTCQDQRLERVWALNSPLPGL